ncbi:MAG: hypothetical protein WA418_10425 [Bradyrhizobium sp.]
MTNYTDFECRLRLPEVDLDKFDDLKKKLREIIDGDAFEKTLTQLKVSADDVAKGPKSKGGDLTLSGSASSGGNWQVGASVTWHF